MKPRKQGKETGRKTETAGQKHPIILLRSKGRSTAARARRIIEILMRTYPDAHCALNYKSPVQLLAATILSAQCTDRRVNIVTGDLFKKYKTAKDFAKADFETFAEEIKPTGFFRNKARNIISCMGEICSLHGGNIPSDMASLVKLPGVGRKTANVVLGTAFGISDGVVVDTHVKRLAYRIGLSDETSPEKIESDLMKIIDDRHWIIVSHLLTHHGRARCSARKPDCENCEIGNECLRRLER